ncbi:AAA family ATPase [Actinomyces lilanjuaniae]|uniref:AAA family ATPase n=1 Tax=Actinomyces lilanjuaniae TaxID=2321394 RepID=A0ABN5PRB4_9ACTO|nr:ATP-binding protein [Actinomyces lilanjuaniae]AYD89091.1 AAA family ATPase [Actinomyces lilanjuaniae]
MTTRRTSDEQIRVLKTWRLIELFSPQKLPDKPPVRKSTQTPDKKTTQTSRVTDWEPSGKRLPWHTLEPVTYHGTSLEWRHTVYLGTYDQEQTYETLHRFFARDDEAYDKHPSGRSACAGIVVDASGCLVPGSAVLSSALWAIGRLQGIAEGAPPELHGFETDNLAFKERIGDLVDEERGPDAGEPQVDETMLVRIMRTAYAAAGLAGHSPLVTWQVRVHSVARSPKRAQEPADTDFLNSFFLEDLARAQQRFASGDVGAALHQYLTPGGSLDTSARVDVVRSPETVDEGVAPQRLPLGRWPSPPEHHLALSQQFAVNHALDDLAPSSGLIGINGPPGTGKTTLLRDVVAGNVVERARRLARLERVQDAFTGRSSRWTTGDSYPRMVPHLRADLTGFEMVVASANNNAVANVTVEVPAQEAIGRRWRDRADYFADLASEVLTRAKAEEGPSGERVAAWGLVAARLGRASYRDSFRSSFWFDADRQHTAGDSGDDEVPLPGMRTRLAAWAEGRQPFRPWPQARRRFHDAARRVEILVRQRVEAQARLARVPALERAVPQAERAASAAGARADQAAQALAARRAAEGDARLDLTRATQRYEQHAALRPGLVETVFSLGRATRHWRLELAALTQQVRTAEDALAQAEAQTRSSWEACDLRQRERTDAEHRLSSLIAELEQLRRVCRDDVESLGSSHPSRISQEKRELQAPWLDVELDVARSELFLAAMDLHQDFAANAAQTMLRGLRAAIDVVGGVAPKDLAPEAVRASWQLFFLVVPLVSTTFASASRMLEGVGREGIGWLLIDEAGQACPQYAVGAAWHARRVVAVGDPLQLEPVVTIPTKAAAALARTYGVDQEWLPPRASVQTLADRVCRLGTTLDQAGEPVWVSTPLRVHRRCDEPMFSLCNQIAYNGLMVNGLTRDVTDPEDLFGTDSAGHPRIWPSSWADEPATEDKQHLQPSQIERLERALRYLAANRVPPTEVIAISPFKEVAGELRHLSRRPEFQGMRAGTIHTAQGREAAVVFLVLGGARDKEGARRWAASSVNLVNVAASRAKRRLYVIGDRTAWSRQPYFRNLAAALQVM